MLQLGTIQDLLQFMSLNLNRIGHDPQDVYLEYELEWQKEETLNYNSNKFTQQRNLISATSFENKLD